MNAKILLIALSAAAFTSCSTAYKSGQTPDDVYYSPVRVVDESRNDNRREEVRQPETTADDARIRMQIRNRRWRDFDNDYDYNYSYNNSPYYYSTCNRNSYGYYYNPYYYSRPIYSTKITAAAPVNSTPRTVNLNSYKNYNGAVNKTKGGNGTNWATPSRQYNNSNSNNGSRVGNIIRQVLTPAPSDNSNNSNSNNNTRTYTPSNNSSNSNSNSGGNSGGSSSGGSSGGSVSRPGRGG